MVIFDRKKPFKICYLIDLTRPVSYHFTIVRKGVRDAVFMSPDNPVRTTAGGLQRTLLALGMAVATGLAWGQSASSTDALRSAAAQRAPSLVIPSAASTGQLPSGPMDEVREVKDDLPILNGIDLTTPPDDLWERLRNGFAMPNLNSPLVLDRQIWYASKPAAIKNMVDRSRRYLYHIVDELEKRGMPTELALLPMVESAFNPMAYSRAHASGLWQFIPSTGKSYNLQQNWWYDARRDIIASTSAALDYLQFLYEMHGDWHLALASYNWGENAVARAIEKNKARGLPTDYLSLTMPQETRYYVPKLQALKNIIANPEAFRLNLDPIPNQPYFVTVAKTKDMDIRMAAKLADMPVEELIALNPANNRPVMSASQGEALVLPADRAELFLSNLENHSLPLVSWQAYTLKSGDKLDRLASQYGITLARLKQVNGITARTKVGPGVQVLVPIKGSAAAAEPIPSIFQPPAMPAVEARTRAPATVRHVVKRGDTLPSIAQQYKVSVDDLRRWNSIGRLAAGQQLTVHVKAEARERSSTASGKSRSAKSKTVRKHAQPAPRTKKPAQPARH
jgi:membrane-bound lytic murein transglycosylase D